jgi:hypothetical protein
MSLTLKKITIPERQKIKAQLWGWDVLSMGLSQIMSDSQHYCEWGVGVAGR